MPASLFSEMDRSGGGLEDQRALQLALELSMLGLNNENDSIGSSFEGEGRNKKSQNTTECVPVPSSEHVAEIVGRQGCKIKALRAKTNTYIKTPVRGEEPVFVVTGRKEDVNAAKREILSAAEHFSQIRAQRKNNLNGSLTRGPNSNIPGQTTIQVRVPYRVVGLVVGPKGATIKRIQQQTNTYIVTPSRDKEPVFEVTGLPDNVGSARIEIEAHIAMRTGGVIDSATDSATDENDFHSNGVDQAFNSANSLFKADLNGLGSSSVVNGGGGGFAPYHRDSNNILTPHSQDVFTFPLSSGSSVSTSSKLAELYGNGTTNGFGGTFSSNGYSIYDADEGLGESPTFEPAIVPPPPSSLWPEFGSNSASIINTTALFGHTSSNGHLHHHHHLANDDHGCSLSRRSSSLSSNGSGHGSSSNGLAPSSSLTDPLSIDHPPARRIRSDPLNGSIPSLVAGFAPLTNGGGAGSTGSGSTGSSSGALVGSGGLLLHQGFPTGSSDCDSGSHASSPTDSLGSSGRKIKRDCIVCFESEVVSALVPCGHNMFCMECANRICEKVEATCPVCNQPASQSIRIFS